MALLITPEHLEYQRQEHARKPRPNAVLPFGSQGYRWEGIVRGFARQIGAKSILDYGAGKGTLSEVLLEPPVTNYDPVTFPNLPDPHDLVVCTDVLPFVEPDCLGAVLDHIKELANLAVLFVVPDHDGKPVPNKLPLDEWESLLRTTFPTGLEVTYLRPLRGTPRMVYRAKC